MGIDHEYALIGGVNRATIGRWIGTLAAGISAVLVFIILTMVDVASSLGIDAKIPPSVFSLLGAGAVYGIFYLLFSKYIWKWEVIVKVMQVPDLSGKWICRGQSSYTQDGDGFGGDWEGIVEISQSWDKLCIVLKTTQSRSESVSAALIAEGSGAYRLLYHYKNDPRVFEDGLHAHHGFVDLLVSSGLLEADGVYFTGRGRTTHGTMSWERIEDGAAN